MEEINRIIIQCPKCKKEMGVQSPNPIHCIYCHEKITSDKKNGNGVKYSILVACVACSIGMVSGSKIDNLFEKNRYPLKSEFSIVRNCVFLSGKKMTFYEYSKKLEICSCALSMTQEDFDYQEFETDENEFVEKLYENTKSCSEDFLSEKN